MPLENDNIVPEDVAGEIELLVQGRGQFVDAEEAGLRREEDVEEADFDDPQAEDDVGAVPVGRDRTGIDCWFAFCGQARGTA